MSPPNSRAVSARAFKGADRSGELVRETLGGVKNSGRETAALSEALGVVLIGLTRAARVLPSHGLRVDPMPDASDKGTARISARGCRKSARLRFGPPMTGPGVGWYLIRYVAGAGEGRARMDGGLLRGVRRAAGLSQDELSRRAGTSRTAVSAYEHGRKSPSLDTVERLLAGAGYELDARPRVGFVEVAGARGRPVSVPNRLPRLPIERALAVVELPLRLNWSRPGRVFRLSDRGDRARVYETVLREGAPQDVRDYVDGALLVDLWGELVLPRDVRAAWSPLIDAVLATPDHSGVAASGAV